MPRRPPFGIASRAFTARFMMTCSICPRSAATDHRPGCRHELQRDVLADQARQHRGDVWYDGIEIDRFQAGHLVSPERQQLPRQGLRSPCRLDDLRERVTTGGGRGRIVGQHLGVTADDRQQVVEVVRHATGQPPKRLHLLRLVKTCFGLLAFLDFPDHLLVGLLQRRSTVFDEPAEAQLPRDDEPDARAQQEQPGQPCEEEPRGQIPGAQHLERRNAAGVGFTLPSRSIAWTSNTWRPEFSPRTWAVVSGANGVQVPPSTRHE